MEPSGSATDDLDGGMGCGVARRGLQRGHGAARAVRVRRRRHTEKLARQPILHRSATSEFHVPQPLPMPTPVQMQVLPDRPPPNHGRMSPSSGPPVSHPSTGQSVRAAFLNIHWFGNGKKCTTANTVRTKQSLIRLDINETQVQPLIFADEETGYAFRSHDRPNAQTIVRRVTLEDEELEVSALGNDLSASAQPPVPDELTGVAVSGSFTIPSTILV